MNHLLSQRINSLSESSTIKMSQLARELKSQGKDIISLSLGQPDFETPTFIKEGAKKAIDGQYSGYSPIPGYLDLQEAICQKLKSQNQLEYNPNQITVSTGAKQSIANAIMCLVNPGDEVVIPAPYWVTYPELVNLTEGKQVVIKTTIKENFKISPTQLEEALNENTKLFLFSSPSNPSGASYSENELKELAKVFQKYPNVFIISDEIYEHISFESKHFSIAQIPELKERTIVVNGLSKSYAMTGWRLGYTAAPLFIAKAMNKLQGQYTSGTCSIAQRAAVTAYQGSMDEVNEMKQVFSKRRDLMFDLLDDIEGMVVNKPDGAFYFFADIHSFLGKKNGEKVINNSEELSYYILEEAEVAVVAGSGFGAEGYIRISYATSDDLLIKAAKQMKEALGKLN